MVRRGFQVRRGTGEAGIGVCGPRAGLWPAVRGPNRVHVEPMSLPESRPPLPAKPPVIPPPVIPPSMGPTSSVPPVLEHPEAPHPQPHSPPARPRWRSVAFLLVVGFYPLMLGVLSRVFTLDGDSHGLALPVNHPGLVAR